MGHIILQKEIEIVEKPLPLDSSRRLDSSTAFDCTRQRLRRNPPNRLLKTWQDCMHIIASLLPVTYRDHWLRSLEQLLHGDGPLPETWRIYIAIMGLCRHEVAWAVKALSNEFLAHDGDRKWLFGLRFAPQKLRVLSQINKLLAHQPWLLTPKHILELTKGEHSWSLGELCQAICLLTHFHGLASFMHSCQSFLHNCYPIHQQSSVSHPLSTKNSPCKANPSTLSSNSCNALLESASFQLEASTKLISEELPETTVTVSPTKVLSSNSSPSHTTTSKSANAVVNGSPSSPVIIPCSNTELNSDIKVTKTVGTPSGSKREIQASPQPSKQSKNESHSVRLEQSEKEVPIILREFSHLSVDLDFIYSDFSKSGMNLFKITEFSWFDRGYCLLSRILNEFGPLLDKRFDSVRTLSHASWNKNLSALHFRTAVWNYIQSLFGIHHDDYDYDLVEKCLSKDILEFVKKSTCSPELLEGQIPLSILSSLNGSSEVIPLSIVIMEGRLQTELLYALRAIISNLC